MNTPIVATLATLAVAAGITAGLILGGRSNDVPASCLDALAAANTIAIAIETQWATASAAVDAAQQALSESGYRDHAATCRASLE
jgi:ribose/xylose/arabinose/galactoside ABC-type transport system permease subunit